MIEKNMVHSGIAYIKEHVPDERYRVYMLKCLGVIVVYYVYSKEFESSEWKDCISQPSLPYVLKILTGLAHHHLQTQVGPAMVHNTM